MSGNAGSGNAGLLPEKIGPYLIQEKIGSGGMGTVYLGRHASTGQVAAVKVLPASLAQEEGFVERFAREIESMQRLSNPHIVQLYSSGTDGGTYFYSMEYVPGETLTSLLRRDGRMEWLRAIDLGVQVCLALKAAHDAGIIHRDLKPSNLLIAPDGTVKLTDFGVAQVFASDRLTITGGIVGTAEFMSPEQAEGKRASKQSDLYSLGAVLYACVTGRPPFMGNTAVDVLQKHRYGRFDAPRLIVPDLPHWFDEIICQLLEKDPAKRFPDAYVLGRRLEQIAKKVELALGETTADARLRSPVRSDDEPTASGGELGPATLMKHLVRAELDQLREGSFWSEFFNQTWVQIVLLLVVLAGGVWWFRPVPLTPEAQFAAGVKLLQQPAGSAWSDARSTYFEPLARRSPEWANEVAPYLRQIELHELKRKVGGKKLNLPRPAPGTEAERLFSRALAQHAAGDQTRARASLSALSTLLAGDQSQTDLYDLSMQLLAEWDAQQPDPKARGEWLDAALRRADALARKGDQSAADQIWSSLLTLYEDEPAAAEYVNRARQALNQERAATP